MAEGWTRHLKGNFIEAFSAGTEPTQLNPFAVKAMAEVGVDISRQKSKHIDDLSNLTFDNVITVCDHANETCPILPGKTKRMHVGFDDPPRLAKDAKSDEEALVHYRRVRDEVRSFVLTLPKSLEN